MGAEDRDLVPHSHLVRVADLEAEVVMEVGVGVGVIDLGDGHLEEAGVVVAGEMDQVETEDLSKGWAWACRVPAGIHRPTHDLSSIFFPAARCDEQRYTVVHFHLKLIFALLSIYQL